MFDGVKLDDKDRVEQTEEDEYDTDLWTLERKIRGAGLHTPTTQICRQAL